MSGRAPPVSQTKLKVTGLGGEVSGHGARVFGGALAPICQTVGIQFEAAGAGYQFSDTIEDTAFGKIDLRWYATDNFAVTVGGDFAKDVTQAHLEVEFMPGFSALPGLAFNVKGVIGDDDYDSVLGGITYYFGSNASLKDRQRRQDPDSALFSLFQAVEQERSKLEKLYAPPVTLLQ